MLWFYITIDGKSADCGRFKSLVSDSNSKISTILSTSVHLMTILKKKCVDTCNEL